MNTELTVQPWRLVFLLSALGALLVSACGGDDKPGGGAGADCEGAKPWPDAAATDGGLTQCANGIVHRRSAPSCTAATPPDLSSDDPAAIACEDVPCTTQPNGFCVATLRGESEPPTITCVYACQTDDDCGAGSACFCGARGGECIPATCKKDADCGSDPCILMYGKLECGVPSTPHLTCFSAERECAADRDCGADSFCIDGSCRPKASTCS